MRILTGLVGFSFVLMAWAGCGGDSPTRPDPIAARQLPEEFRAEASDLVQGNNAFALDLYHQLAKADDGNLFLSPFSISTAFAMTYGGARGRTEAEMAQVFRFPLDQDRLHPVFGALLKSLDTGMGFDGYRLNIANRLFGQEGYGFLDAYLGLTRDHYDAELEPMDFVGDPDGSRRHINAWVEDRTEERIKDLLPERSITSNTVLVLVNAIYFKGNWAARFDAAKTEDSPFHVAPGNEVTVPIMHQKQTFPVGHGEGVELLELPYQGQDLSMIVLLPNAEDGLADLENRLTPENLTAWLGTMHDTELDIYLPKFTVTSKFKLKQTLSVMGMPTAFGPTADFTGMNGIGGLFISDAYHKAFVTVDEEGTEAAAATAVVIDRSGVPSEFRADHPFLFLIRDNVTGSILFLGRVVDPSDTGE
jgi:serpin B